MPRAHAWHSRLCFAGALAGALVLALPAFGQVPGTHVTLDPPPGFGTPIRIYQLIADDGGNYFIVQGFVGQGNAAQFLAKFREVARSLRKAQ